MDHVEFAAFDGQYGTDIARVIRDCRDTGETVHYALRRLGIKRDKFRAHSWGDVARALKGTKP